MDVSKVVCWISLSIWALFLRVCQAGRCEQITVNFCRGQRYNFTSMPNGLGQNSQHDVNLELMYLRELVDTKCSPHIRKFLCAMYLPRCSWKGPNAMRVEHPCRQDCEIVKNGCEHYLNRSGSQWPGFLSCKRLPNRACLHISALTAPTIDIILAEEPRPHSAAVSQYLLTSCNLLLLVASSAINSLYNSKWL